MIRSADGGQLMDGGRRAHLDAKNTSAASAAHRCGWCALLALPEDLAVVEGHQLRGVCFGFLRDVDWRRVLNEGQRLVSSIPVDKGRPRLEASRGGRLAKDYDDAGQHPVRAKLTEVAADLETQAIALEGERVTAAV
jgi:hypothetical protein